MQISMSVVCSVLNLGNMEEEAEDFGKYIVLRQTFYLQL